MLYSHERRIVLGLFKLLKDAELVLPRVGFASLDELFAVVLGHGQFALTHGIPELPVQPFATGDHVDLGQIQLLAPFGPYFDMPRHGGDPEIWAHNAALNWALASAAFKAFLSYAIPGFDRLQGGLHGDHDEVFNPDGSPNPGCLIRKTDVARHHLTTMVDASRAPSISANIAATAALVQRFRATDGRRHLGVEACLEQPKTQRTGETTGKGADPDTIVRMFTEGLADMVVIDAGTHSISAQAAQVNWDNLDRVAADRRIPHQMVVHGGSSISGMDAEQVRKLARRKVIFINVYTGAAKRAAEAELKRASLIIGNRRDDLQFPFPSHEGLHPPHYFEDGSDGNQAFTPLFCEARRVRVITFAREVERLLGLFGWDKLGVNSQSSSQRLYPEG